MQVKITPKKSINIDIIVPGDKSISHRAVMFGAISEGVTQVSGFLTGDDCMSTISCFKKLGIDIDVNGSNVNIYGKGINGLKKPSGVLDVGNSGTTIRLMSGLLAAQPFSCEITGDSSIQKRPMSRVITPLSEMGADINGLKKDGFAPIKINGRKLKGIEYKLPIASAQVKSAILIASLYADRETTIIEPEASRDHTEIMLNYLGAEIENINGKITSRPVKQLYAKKIFVPGDISSAAFFIVAGLIIPNSHVMIKNVGTNVTRTGIIDALKKMGGNIQLKNRKFINGEEVSDIDIKSSKLKGIVIEGSIIPRMIDEIPIFSIAAIVAEGETIIKDASELKVKESNRISTMSEELSKMGICITETKDGMIIKGNQKFKGAVVESHNDHRVAMSLAIAALLADSETTINNSECVNISFPGFFEYISSL